MSRICVDTSAYSHFKRGDPRAIAALHDARSVFVPSIVLGELRAGFRMGRHAERNEEDLRVFLDHPAVTILDVDDEASSGYAELFAQLRRAGTPLPTNDVWIAAVALREGATVVTYDEHFASMPSVGARILKPASPKG